MTIASDTPRAAIPTGNLIRNLGFVGLGAIGILVGLSDMLARAPANATDIGSPLLAPSSQFPFGTDILGRDMASETLHALAVTTTSGLFGAVVTVLCGGLAGFLVARLPYVFGALLRQAAATLCAVPALFLGILFIGLADRNLAPLAAGLAAAPLAFARSFDRARNLHRSRYAEVAYATGISPGALTRRDLIYEFRDRLLVNLSRSLGDVVLILSTVSFLGFGAIPPHRDLGLMIGAARDTFLGAWWTAAFPALALIVLILCARLVCANEGDRRP